MGVFNYRKNFEATDSTQALGGSYRRTLTREYHVSKMFIEFAFTVGTVAATMNADGLLALVKRVQLQISDGTQTRNVVDATGSGLIELALNQIGGLDRGTLNALGKNATGAYTIRVPILCEHPQLQDPLGSRLILPFPRFNSDPVLNVQFASQTEIDTNVSPTFALTGNISVRVIVIRSEVSVPSFDTLDWEIAEVNQPYTASGAGQTYEFQPVGSYTGILMRCYQSLTARGNVLTVPGEARLQLFQNVIRRFTLADIEFENDYSKYGQTLISGQNIGLIQGSYYMDFLTDKAGESVDELGSVLDANMLSGSGARIQLVADVNGGANVSIRYLTHRIFGNLDNFKRRTLAAPKA